MRRVLAAGLCAALLCLPVQAVSAEPERARDVFRDIADSFAEQPIRELTARGVITGKGDGRFDPHSLITRDDFLTMLSRTLNIEGVDGAIPVHTDVSPNGWIDPYIQAGTALGLAGGRSSFGFEPNRLITREEAATLLVKAIHEETQRGGEWENAYPDAAMISPWARPFVETAHRLGLMCGDERGFRPEEGITREETAEVLWQVLCRQSRIDAVPVTHEERKGI